MKNWRNIHPDFTEELQAEWENKGFSAEECKEWIDSGLGINDGEYAYWLSRIVKLTTDEILGEDSDEELRDLYKSYQKEGGSKNNFKEKQLEKPSNTNKSVNKVCINVQEWLDRNYSKERCLEIREIYLSEPNLEGELDIKEFVELERICISHYINENKLKIEVRGNIEVVKLANAQEWLDNHYPKIKRNKIKGLHIREKGLEGSLDLSDFTNLEMLDCSHNKITSLNLTGLEKLVKLECNYNLLGDFNYFLLNFSELNSLEINDNNLRKQDLSVFSQFINLKTLWIGNNGKEKIQNGFYNRFYGSLEHLKNLTKLKNLHISNTDINNGVEFLPDGIGEIYYSFKERPESKIKEINKRLDSFVSERISINWKNIHPDLDKWKQREWEAFGFDYQQTKEWIEAGLQANDYQLASYLREKNYKTQEKLNWDEIRKEVESISAQEWLFNKYLLEEKEEVSFLDISKKNLGGKLVIENLPKLIRLDCTRNRLTILSLINLPEITHVFAYNNSLTNLVIINCPKITILKVQNNCLSDLDFLNNLNHKKLNHLLINNNEFPSHDINIFSKFVNLKELRLTNNLFYGSLNSLKNLNKLEYLSIANNKINDDLEYLPNSLKEIAYEPSQISSKEINNFKLLGWIGTIKGKKNNLPYYDFQYWKEAQPYFKWLKEEIEKLNPNLNVYDVMKNVFFNVKTGEFVGNFQAMKSLLEINKGIIEQKSIKINLLELQIEDLIEQIKKQWDKVYNAYLYCVSKPEEKELLDNLIKIHIEFTKFKKESFSSDDYHKKCRDYRNRCQEVEVSLEELLEGRLGSDMVEETMNKVEHIIRECKKIAKQQLKLKEKNSIKLLLTEEKKQIPQTTISKKMNNALLSSSIKEGKDVSIEAEHWKKKHIDDIKQKNVRITELEEQLTKLKLELESKIEIPTKNN